MVATQKVGFRIPKRTARLVFEGDYQGAEVVVRLDVPVGTFLEIQDLIEEEKQLRVFELFGDAVLDEWNIEDSEGTPLPCNGKGMNLVPVTLANAILAEWSEVAVQAPSPLENN